MNIKGLIKGGDTGLIVSRLVTVTLLHCTTLNVIDTPGTI